MQKHISAYVVHKWDVLLKQMDYKDLQLQFPKGFSKTWMKDLNFTHMFLGCPCNQIKWETSRFEIFIHVLEVEHCLTLMWSLMQVKHLNSDTS